jgi:predicted DNA-binding transcriptional regulator AlpA
MSTPIIELDLSIRALKRLRDAGVKDLEELQEWTETKLRALPGLGAGCVREIREQLQAVGLSLRPGDPRPRYQWRKTTKSQVAEIRRRYQSGEPARALATEFGISKSRVMQLCPRRQDRADTELAQAEVEKLIALRAEGRTQREIAQRLGLTIQGVRYHTGKLEDPTLHGNLSATRRATEILREFTTAPDAASELGISRFTMHEYLQAGKFPGAFQIGSRGWWLVPRAAVEARKKAKT